MNLKNICFAILLLKTYFFFSQQKLIVIDPGHGGYDSGAIGINSIQEKDVALNIAKEVLKLNKSLFDNELDIYLTRYTDTLILLSDRSRFAKNFKPDVFVSLHCNHSDNKNTRGIEVYIHNSDSQFTKESIGLGLAVLNESSQKLGFEKRGAKFANFQVLRETVDYCPSVLVEMGFMSNIDETNYFLKRKNVRAIALAILIGITNYLNSES